MTACLACMQASNYAAVALKLQRTALDAEACIYEMERNLRRVANPDTTIFTTTALISVPISADLTPLVPSTGNEAITFSNNTGLSSIVSGYTPGVWQIGAIVNAIASGAVNDNTYRNLYIRVRRSLTDPDTVPDFYRAMASATESNTGVGVDITLSATVVFITGNEQVEIAFQHGNAASAINISIGSTWWATKLSTQTTLGVVT